jgi:hypothetical protein
MSSQISSSYVLKFASAFCVAFVRERVKRYFLIQNVFEGNITLCRRQRVACELGGMALNAVFYPLERDANRLTFGPKRMKISVTAHADDATIIITDKADVNKVKEIIRTRENTTFATVSIHQSTTLSIGLW